jgi:hypothetical protein
MRNIYNMRYDIQVQRRSYYKFNIDDMVRVFSSYNVLGPPSGRLKYEPILTALNFLHIDL